MPSERFRIASRSASGIGPICDAGGAIHARSVIVGLPCSSSSDTSASPTASSVIAVAVSTIGLGRSVSAAIRTAF
jgi:hypothetical protein